MSFRLRILPAADRDIDEIAMYIAAGSGRHAVRFYDAVARTCEMICDAPRRWAFYGFEHPRLRELRKRSVLKFQRFLIFYRVDADVVEIVRVVHGARDLPVLFGETPPSGD